VHLVGFIIRNLTSFSPWRW